LDGPGAAALLIRNQLAGIRKMAKAGTMIKVNTVLIPGINDGHIAEIARTVAVAGANLYNLIPLIPQHRLSDLPAPTCEALEEARQQAKPYIEVFRHCQHCRADAIGIPGVSDYTPDLALGRAEEVFSHG
jgi:nitrogen fixation protein NifB